MGWRPPTTSPRTTASRNVAVHREGLARRRQHRAATPPIIRSNYFYPESAALYELSLQALRGAVARAQLQHHALPARHGRRSRTADGRDGNRRAHRQRDADQRHRRRAADGRRRATRDRAAAQSSATDAAIRSSAAVWQGRGRHRAPRRGGLGLCARRRSRSASTSSRIARSPASSSRAAAARGVETTQGPIRAERVGLAVAGHSSRARREGRLPAADHVPMRCRRWCPSRSSRCLDTVVLCRRHRHLSSASRTRARSSSAAALDRCRPTRSAATCRCTQTCISGLLEMFPALRPAAS